MGETLRLIIATAIGGIIVATYQFTLSIDRAEKPPISILYERINIEPESLKLVMERTLGEFDRRISNTLDQPRAPTDNIEVVTRSMLLDAGIFSGAQLERYTIQNDSAEQTFEIDIRANNLVFAQLLGPNIPNELVEKLSQKIELLPKDSVQLLVASERTFLSSFERPSNARSVFFSLGNTALTPLTPTELYYERNSYEYIRLSLSVFALLVLGLVGILVLVWGIFEEICIRFYPNFAISMLDPKSTERMLNLVKTAKTANPKKFHEVMSHVSEDNSKQGG